MDNDYLLALKLQEEFNGSTNNKMNINLNKSAARKTKKYYSQEDEDESELNRTTNLVHPAWETIDPTPDIHTMFGAFDLKFFQGKLECVQLEWSKKMYNCAGICYSRSNRLGMQCTIRLSEPLLKLRPRKNLVETLLHEMIHAYLFIKNIREGNGGHGPNFKKMMEGINRAAGTNITVYHTFIDEVNLYKTHWWRCNGICQHRKPFYGYVRRSYNRPPGPSDFWWKNHHESCSGTFEKIKEPEKKTRASKSTSSTKTKIARPKTAMPKGEIKANNVPNIRQFFPTVQPTPALPATNSNTSSPKSIPPVRKTGNLSNVVGFRDLVSSDDEASPHVNPRSIPIEPFSGKGRNLSDSSLPPASRPQNGNVHHTVRNMWAKRFESTDTDIPQSSKRLRLDEKNSDDDLILIERKPTIVDILDSDEEIEKRENIRRRTNQTPKEKQDEILKEICDSNNNSDDDDDENDVIDLIDGDYDDSIVNDPTELIDKTVMEDLFGEDTLLKRYQSSTSSTSQNSDLICLTENNIISCPLCQEKMSRNDLSIHLEGCLGIRVEVKQVKYNVQKKLPFYKNNKVKKSIAVDEENSSDDEIYVPSSPAIIPRQENRLGSSSVSICPVCNKPQEGDINEHLDLCLVVLSD